MMGTEAELFVPWNSIDGPIVVLNLGSFYLKQQISQPFDSLGLYHKSRLFLRYARGKRFIMNVMSEINRFITSGG